MRISDLEQVNKLVSRRNAIFTALQAKTGDYVTFSFRREKVNSGAQVGFRLDAAQIELVKTVLRNEMHEIDKELKILGVHLS